MVVVIGEGEKAMPCLNQFVFILYVVGLYDYYTIVQNMGNSSFKNVFLTHENSTMVWTFEKT